MVADRDPIDVGAPLETTSMGTHRLLDDDGRRPGCGPGCRRIQALLPGVFGRSSLLLHDPGDHEWYGEHLVRGHDGPAALVVTGRLVVDLERLQAQVDGRDIYCTPNEVRLLRALARRIGRTVEHVTLLCEVWGIDGNDRTTRMANRHLLRVTTARLRRRLGAAGTLLVTLAGLGYRLELAEAGTTLPPPTAHPCGWAAPLASWSRRFDRCVRCGTSSIPHKAKGTCSTCYDRGRCHRRHHDD